MDIFSLFIFILAKASKKSSNNLFFLIVSLDLQMSIIIMGNPHIGWFIVSCVGQLKKQNALTPRKFGKIFRDLLYLITPAIKFKNSLVLVCN